MLTLNKRLNAAPAMRYSSHGPLQPCAASAMKGQGLPDIHRNNMGPRAIDPSDIEPSDIGPSDIGPSDIDPSDIGPSDIGPSDIEFVDTGFGDIGSCNTRPRDIDQLSQRLDALRLVARDLSEQLAQTYLPPEAHATVWQGVGEGAGGK
jgi:hypothetical protein